MSKNRNSGNPVLRSVKVRLNGQDAFPIKKIASEQEEIVKRIQKSKNPEKQNLLRVCLKESMRFSQVKDEFKGYQISLDDSNASDELSSNNIQIQIEREKMNHELLILKNQNKEQQIKLNQQDHIILLQTKELNELNLKNQGHGQIQNFQNDDDNFIIKEPDLQEFEMDNNKFQSNQKIIKKRIAKIKKTTTPIKKQQQKNLRQPQKNQFQECRKKIVIAQLPGRSPFRMTRKFFKLQK